MKYKVSIIVPVYNVEKYLRECLDSLVNQTLKDIEIICINDASPDNSLKILKEYKKKNPKLIKIIDLKKNVGQGCARNHGLDKAQGEYISFVDSDDYVDVTMCEKLYAFAKKNGADLVQFNYMEFFEKNYKNQNSIVKRTNSKYFSGPDLCVPREKFISKATVVVWARFCHRSTWDNIRFPDLVHEDVAIYFFHLVRAQKIVKLEDSLYFYRKRICSITTSGIKFSNVLKALEFMLIESNKRNLISQYEKPIFSRISRELCDMLFKHKYLYKDIPTSIYDKDAILDKHIKKMSKIYPKYKDTLIKMSTARNKIYLKLFFSFPLLLKNILYIRFLFRRLRRSLFG
jgi:glycosyltransferase involved in cell wall biosynthesis